MSLTISILLCVPLFFGFRALKRRWERIRCETREVEERRTAKIGAFFTELRKEAIPHTRLHTLQFCVGDIRRSTEIVYADKDTLGMRFVASFGVFEDHHYEPTGWGDASWTEFSFGRTSCPSCEGVAVTLCRMRRYDLKFRKINAESIAPCKLAKLCLECHETAEIDMEHANDEDILFTHRCQEASRRAGRLQAPADGPYRSVA